MPAQVDLSGAQTLGVTAQLGHARFEADTRARGGMLENHRQTASLEKRRERPAPIQRLQGGGQIEQTQQLFTRVVLVGKEVAAAYIR